MSSKSVKLKARLAYIFVVLYILAMVRPIAPLFEYIIYEDYITEFLCINKDTTELNCNGKCYLMERLAQENQDKKENLPKIALEEYPIGFVQLFQISVETSLDMLSPSEIEYINFYHYLLGQSEDRPPNRLAQS